jgi:hypothetical protein
MSGLTEAFPGSQWLPPDEIRLIEWVAKRCQRAARDRYAKATVRYRDTHGKVGRTRGEETATVLAQAALQLLLGLPLLKPDTMEEARSVGNAGGGHRVFTPHANAVHHHLIVPAREPDSRVCWLVAPTGERSFRVEGWIRAYDAKQEPWHRVRRREGGTSDAYWVPVGALRSIGDWWDENG